jgi:hypothetical protein
MRSSLLQLVSFQLAVTVLLATVPVRLIFLALNPRTHVNQFVHSSYPQAPTLSKVLPMAFTASRDATG